MGHRAFRRSAAAASGSAAASSQGSNRSETVSPRRPLVQSTPRKQVVILVCPAFYLVWHILWSVFLCGASVVIRRSAARVHS